MTLASNGNLARAIGLACIVLFSCACGDGRSASGAIARAGEPGPQAASSATAAPSATAGILEESRHEIVGPADAALDEVAALRQGLAEQRARTDEMRADYEARIRSLQAELQTSAQDRLDREREWLRYTQGMARLSSIAGASSLSFKPGLDPLAIEAVPLEPGASRLGAKTSTAPGASPIKTGAAPLDTSAPAAHPAHAVPDPAPRSREVFLALRTLFTIEQVAGFDLLESGVVHAGCTGPVVLRVLDDHGRPVGTLCAERLRLEASRSARTLTLVLEDGYERRGGERIPFETPLGEAQALRKSGPGEAQASPTPPPGESQVSPARDAGGVASPAGETPPAAVSEKKDVARTGVRRILLAGVDPRAWIETIPELFTEESKAPPADDGRWDLSVVRATLNALLREDAANGYWRIVGLAGVQAKLVRDVQLDFLDRDGRLEKKLFADRLEIKTEGQGIQILLEDGAQLRGDKKTPFLDGRYRIFLPRASTEAWAAAGVPGLSAPRERR